MRADFVAWQKNETKFPLLVVIAFSYFSEVLSVKTQFRGPLFYPIDLSAFWFCFESLSNSDWLIFIATNFLFELLLGYLWGPVGIVDTFLKIFDVGHFQIHIDLSSISNHTER